MATEADRHSPDDSFFAGLRRAFGPKWAGVAHPSGDDDATDDNTNDDDTEEHE